MPTFQPFQNGINSVRAELSAATRAGVGVLVETKAFLRPGEHSGILPPKARRHALTGASVRPAPFGGAHSRQGGQLACEAALPFEASTALIAAPGLPEPSAPTARYCPPSSRFSLLEGIGAYVRRTLPFNRVNEGVSPSGGGVISGALDDPGANGLVARTAYNETVAREIVPEPLKGLAVSNGDGVSGDPTLFIGDRTGRGADANCLWGSAQKQAAPPSYQDVRRDLPVRRDLATPGAGFNAGPQCQRPITIEIRSQVRPFSLLPGRAVQFTTLDTFPLCGHAGRKCRDIWFQAKFHAWISRTRRWASLSMRR